jgi:hypothetical protein
MVIKPEKTKKKKKSDEIEANSIKLPDIIVWQPSFKKKEDTKVLLNRQSIESDRSMNFSQNSNLEYVVF